MRSIFTISFAVFLCPTSVAGAIEMIDPGMSLGAATAVFRKHGYDVDAQKYGLAMAARDREHGFEFCRIDAQITLVMEYRLSNGKINSLGIVIISEPAPKLKRRQISLEVLEMGLEEGDVYTLKLKRQTTQAVGNKAAESH